MPNIPVILDLIARKSPGVSSALSETQKQYQDLAISIEDVSLKAAKMATLATAAIGGLLVSTTRTAGQFEQLQTKLEALSGSTTVAAAKFNAAVSLAAKSPFDVKNMVDATAQIEAFGQSSARSSSPWPPTWPRRSIETLLRRLPCWGRPSQDPLRATNLCATP